MNTPLSLHAKPLPIPTLSSLPLPPPPADARHSLFPPPTPPPKMSHESGSNLGGPSPLQIITMPPDTGPVPPPTPSDSIHSIEGKAKKTNPLTDLIETERAYVDQLTGIIRKVAAAWSRSNLPPHELDCIFRCVESVYKANRSLLSKLKEIGTNPSSPKALGDLLMRWIDDLEGPYTAYCTEYCTGFDVWEPIQTNERLQTILVQFSASTPPPPSLLPNLPEPSTWTLDALFLLPKIRLKYYKKLYTRLQKSTTPGRSDHRLLIGALEKLDRLLSTLESRENLKVGTLSLPPPAINTEDTVVVDMRAPSVASEGDSSHQGQVDSIPGRDNSSYRGSSLSSGERLSREAPSTSTSPRSTMTTATPISDLERRLATERTLDIFTMTPKVVRLQMNPPSLTFMRELRFSIDVVIRFTPRSTGLPVMHRHGHVVLLSDLFLVCERMSPEDRAQRGKDGPDMWLCYPPLAGKVLRVSEVDGQNNALQVDIMRKETLILEAESVDIRDIMMLEFRECIEFAGGSTNQLLPSVHGRPQRALSPSPSLNHHPQSGFPTAAHDGGNMASPPQGSSLSVGVPPMVNHPGGQQIIRPSSNPDRPVRSPEPQGSYLAPSLPRMHSQGSLVMPANSRSPAKLEAPLPPTIGPPAGGHPLRAGAPQPPPPNYYPAPNRPFPNDGGSFGPPLSPSGREFQGVQGSSSRSIIPPYIQPGLGPPPMASPYNGPPHPNFNTFNRPSRNDSYAPLQAPQPRPLLPSAQVNTPPSSLAANGPSPPNSPIEERLPTGPTTSTVCAQMKCKVFLKQQHGQWKSLGAARLKLYQQQPTNVKQLVVEADNRGGSILISTIVLTDGVERVGKTGVAVELSDKGMRTGIIYMIQLRNETSAGGLFDSLLAGSDRSGRG